MTLEIFCTGVKVIDPKSALSSVFGSKHASFSIGKGQKMSILIKTGMLEYWKLKLHNKFGIIGNYMLSVENRGFGSNPALHWISANPCNGPRGLRLKFRPSFFGL